MNFVSMIGYFEKSLILCSIHYCQPVFSENSITYPTIYLEPSLGYN
jgi:hypothetical protein